VGETFGRYVRTGRKGGVSEDATIGDPVMEMPELNYRAQSIRYVK
jgi:hypothetical protein